MVWRTLICVIFTAAVGTRLYAASPSSRPADNPAVEEIKGLMAEGRFDDALAPLEKMMAQRGHDADDFSRHEVLMLVAECRLQLRHVADTLSVLDLAAREAEASKNWPRRAEASSLAMLLRTAPKLTYTPQTGDDHAPLDLTDRGQRRTAFKKLYDEMHASCEGTIREAREYESLQPLLDATAAFTACRALEQVTTNATTQSDALGDRLAAWSKQMVRATLDGFTKRINVIVADSNVGMAGRKHKGPAGLSAQERSDLEVIGATCGKVPAAIDALNAAFARPLMTDWASEQADARNIATRAQAILESDQRIVRNRK